MAISIFTVKKGCINFRVYFSTELFYHGLPIFASCWKIRTESSEFKGEMHLCSLLLQDEVANSQFSGNTVLMQLSMGTQPELFLSFFSQEG